MEQSHRVYIRTQAEEDNTNASTILDIVKFRHPHFINLGIVEAYWRGFAEETLALTIYDDEEQVLETVELIQQELNHKGYIFVESNDVTIV